MRCLATVGLLLSGLIATPAAPAADDLTVVTGEVRDADTGKLLPARLYIQSAEGKYFFAESASRDGSAVRYAKQRPPVSVELHTTLSAHPFTAKLPPGKYTLSVVRGKEYLLETQTVRVGDQPVRVSIKLRRWINMGGRGWYSGDTHVHRTLDELPNVVMAEDLNVALPLTHWVTSAYTPPSRGDKNSDIGVSAKLITVDPAHVIYPLNTEYEIFRVGGKRHTLGAVFILNHKSPLKIGAPPVAPIAAEARRQGAILDLDKHSWPWSLMLMPVMNVDLFELSNNHVWRTEFAFRQWTYDTWSKATAANKQAGFTERDWIEFGFNTYYTLLNCGFRMRPTAGTASGVHPVPLGFGRVYVQLEEGFNYDSWITGLNAGRSFVTTGPMLFVKFNGQSPGHIFKMDGKENPRCHIVGSVASALPLDRIEIVVNGDVLQTLKPDTTKTKRGGYESPINTTVSLPGSGWVVVRCYEKHPNGRFRFAHSSPVHFDVPGKPVRPRRRNVEFFIRRMEEELARSKDVLKSAELDEYRQALEVYRKIAKTGR